jgi:hypothetical protein
LEWTPTAEKDHLQDRKAIENDEYDRIPVEQVQRLIEIRKVVR